MSDYRPDPVQVKRLLAGTRDRSKLKGQPCQLTSSDVEMLLGRSAGCCELTGIEFSKINPSSSRRSPFSPSIDRVDSSKPYSVKNCRVVCTAVNIALSDWGEAVFKEVARGYCKINEVWVA